MQGENPCCEYLGLNPKRISPSCGRKAQTKFYSRVRKHPNVVIAKYVSLARTYKELGRGNVPSREAKKKIFTRILFNYREGCLMRRQSF